MDIRKLNKLVEKACIISQHMQSNGQDPLLIESLAEYITEIKMQYSDFIIDKLFDFYEDYFEDNEMESLENYLVSEVTVYGDEFEQNELLLGVKASPLRIEVYDINHNYRNVLWQAA